MVLELLDSHVRECIRKRGFTRLSPAQEQAIPLILAKKNLVLIAPTGTGKTESAMFPVFDALLKMPAGGGFKAIYVTPLRSLNRDILARMEWWCRELGLTVGVRHGDTPMGERQEAGALTRPTCLSRPRDPPGALHGKAAAQAPRTCAVRDHRRDPRDGRRASGGRSSRSRSNGLSQYAGEFQRIGLSATVGNPETIARFLCGERPCEIVQVPVAKQLEITVSFVGDDFKHQVQALEGALEYGGLDARLCQYPGDS